MGREFRKPANVIYVCNGPKCKKKGGKELRKFFKKLVSHEGLSDTEVIRTGCTDRCKFAPVVALQPENEWYPCVNEEKAKEIIEKHLQEKDNKAP